MLEAKVVHVDSVMDSKFSSRIEKAINDVLALDQSWEYKNGFEAGKQVHLVFVRSKDD